jgi:pimeloyl-ACP methyl ester carboxylesterase
VRITAADGVALELRDLGGSGPPVLFAHGLGFNGAVWEPVAAALPNVRAFSLDLRGHGASTVEPGHRFSWEAFALDARAAAAAVHAETGERPVGVGHSGGAVALQLAADAFAALLLYEPPGTDGAPAERVAALVAAARRRRDWFPSLDAAEATLAVRDPLKRFAPAARAAYVREGFGPGPQETVRLVCRPDDEARMYELGAPPEAPSPACRTLCLVGETSESWRRREASEPFAGAGHSGPLERPEAFAARLERFLTSLG